MGRGKIAERSAVAHFRVDSDHKQFLEDFAQKHGKGFSDLARDAVKKYVEALWEEEEINRLRGSENFEDVFSEYDRASETKDFFLLDKFVSSIHQEYVSSIQKRQEKDSGGAVLPEIKKLLLDLKLDIAHRYLIFAIQYKTLKEQLRTSLAYMFSKSELQKLSKKPLIKKEARRLKEEIETKISPETLEKLEKEE